MADIQTINSWTKLTAIPFTSGTLNISGVKNAYDLNAVVQFATTSGFLRFTSGNFDNAVNIDSPTNQSGLWAIAGVDGTKVDKNNNTIGFYCNTSGTMYLFSRK